MKKPLIIIFLIVSNITFGQTEQSIYDQDIKTVLKYFRAETIGGKLDFEEKMKDNNAPFYLIDRIMYNRKDYGILLWAQAIKQTQKFSKKEATKLWEEIKNRKLTKPEKKAFKKGFEMELN